MNAIGYVRVSKLDERGDGLSLEAQEKKIRRYAEDRDLVVTEILCDAGVSGSVPIHERPAGAKLLEALERRDKAAPRAVVVYKLDRLFRSTTDCLQVVDAWDKRGVSLHLLSMGGQALDTMSATGRFFFTVLAAVAEFERAMTAERTASTLAHLRDLGRRSNSTPPYGHRFEGSELVVDDAEAEVLGLISTLRSEGLSAERITAELNERGVAARGARWHATTVKRLLKQHERTGTRKKRRAAK